MRNAGILPDAAARAKAAVSARRSGATTPKARSDAERDAGSEEVAGRDARREDECTGRDEARVDKRAATALTPLSLNI
jgi:hypothetical protein